MSCVQFRYRGPAAAVLVLTLGLMVESCTTVPTSSRTSASLPQSSASAFSRACVPANSKSATVRDLKAKIHAYTNANRRRHGASAVKLTCEQGLTLVADSHSDWMAQAKKMSHRDNRGQVPYDRVIAHYPSYQGSIAENLGVITTTYSGPGSRTRADNYSFNSDEMAKNFVDGWMNSPGHRKNLLHPRMTHLGVGVALRGTSIYVTQVFADPAE